MSDYASFLASKRVTAPRRGLADVPTLAAHLFRFQREAVAFGLMAGSWGCYLSTGLGKTACELEWSRHAAEASNGRALILTPLAVARQIEREGQRWGYQVRVIREQREAGDGINVCNYDRIEKLDLDAFGAVACDESSIVKAFTGSTSRALRAALAGHRWRMAASATPAPNDHMELGQQAELLGVMPAQEMLMRWFINDTSTASQEWRLKGHAATAFWDWLASWARAAEHPRDLGDDVHGYDLIPLRTIRHQSAAEPIVPEDGTLFAGAMISATSMHDVKRQTARARAESVASMVAADSAEPWVVWCDTNYEADELLDVLGCISGVVEVRGSQSIDEKEAKLAAFADGSARVLISKPSVCGFGLNWQHCTRTAFVGRSFSFEAWYQAIRRFWRFGQQREVECHLIVADGEDHIGRVIDRKHGDHQKMLSEMKAAMRRAVGAAPAIRQAYQPTYDGRLPSWMRMTA